MCDSFNSGAVDTGDSRGWSPNHGDPLGLYSFVQCSPHIDFRGGRAIFGCMLQQAAIMLEMFFLANYLDL